ncbi:MAG: pantetheine-phosphate adenylyltransferase [Alphaproteobacteria bacterium TMED89]|nr:pantetheine-phosphate adenylyltransferase [Rhodospirillaceae bacterium]RPH11271.1 MAG: pantetheine-phosphate adenylyltransferase [Alphaproteobacteria bacterium TMED89]
MRRVGLYPGTFDPVTNGHLDIMQRATHVVDHLIIAVANSPGKNPAFTPPERVQLLQDLVDDCDFGDCTVEVRSFGSLLMHFADEVGASLVIRGLRAVSDFEYEFQLATMNKALNPKVETVFLTASESQQFIASSLVKEIASLGGDVSDFVPEMVLRALKIRYPI